MKLRIHLIDDDQKFIDLLARQCKRAGHKVTRQVFDGDSDATLLTSPISRADLILVDVGLGLADGIHIAQVIRKMLESWGKPGRVALMSALPTNRDKAKAKGFLFFDKEYGMAEKMGQSFSRVWPCAEYRKFKPAHGGKSEGK